MTRPPNPITQGFRATVRNPALFLLEIGWRWSFWIAAALIIFRTGIAILDQLQLSDLVTQAWRTQNSRLLVVVGLSILIKPAAILWRVFLELLALSFALALLWSLLVAAARRITVRTFESGRPPLRFGGMLAVQSVRGLATLVAGLLLIASLLAAIYFATKGRTDLGRFYLIAVPATLVIVVLWLILNWRLSQAAIFGRAGHGFGAARREARRNIRRHTSDFAGIAFVFLLLRGVLALIALSIIGLTSSMMTSALSPYLKLCVGVLVAYCIFADFLYLARTAAYLALAAQPDPLAAEMGIVDPELPVEKSSSA